MPNLGLKESDTWDLDKVTWGGRAKGVASLQVLGDLDTDSEFRKEFHKLIWNVHIGPEVFENRWNTLITRIPESYIHRRWTKEAIPAHLLEKRHGYGPCIEETDRLAAEVHATIEDCVGLLRSYTDKLTQFLITEALYADLLGVTVPEQVVIKNPKKSSNKGFKRRKSATEIVKAKKKPKTTRKVPFKHRTCSKCGKKGQNKRKCTGKKVMKEDELQDVDEVYESDADTASGEDNSIDEDTSVDVESDED
nr:hypothetical protein [Tanacetum cinerariifolium]